LSGIHPATAIIPFVILLGSLTIHEVSHALAADRLGDPTARRLGRLTLNPLVHIDPIGTLLLPLLAVVSGVPIIGWARPVPVDFRFLKSGRRDFLVIAAAGPASNLALALGASIAWRGLGAGLEGPAGLLLWIVVSLNVLLAVFNMVPIPPLDGGNVLAGLLPPALADRFDRVRPFGFVLLYVLLATGLLSALIDPPSVVLVRLLVP
jgi:Zn-dependent protease